MQEGGLTCLISKENPPGGFNRHQIIQLLVLSFCLCLLCPNNVEERLCISLINSCLQLYAMRQCCLLNDIEAVLNAILTASAYLACHVVHKSVE